MNLVARLRQNEPVALYVGTAVTIVLGLLVTQGVITKDLSDWIIVGATLLLGTGGTVAARNRVRPEAKVALAINEARAEAATQVGVAVTNAQLPLPPSARLLIEQAVEQVPLPPPAKTILDQSLGEWEHYGKHARKS